MGQKDLSNESGRKVEAVLQILRKQSPLSVKQEKFCNNACVERFLKAKGDNVKKAAKSLRACLAWRESICTDHLIADEFSIALAEGVAYVAGHDEEYRPVLIFRIKQDYQKFHSQKTFTRLLVFTLEVAVGTMTKNADQFVILLDACFFKSASAFMNLLLTTLKIVSDYYPGRLHKAFVVDPPSFFSYLWKGVRPFIDLATTTFIVSSVDFQDALDLDDFSTYPRAESLRFDSTTTTAARIGACSSSRFAFTVSTSFDALKPWHLSLSDTARTGPTSATSPSSNSLLGPALISPLNARSFSFASPTARAPRGFNSYSYAKPVKRNMFCPSTPLPAKSESMCDPRKPVIQPRTPKASFLQSPGLFFKKESHQHHHHPTCHVAMTRSEKSKEAFGPYLKFYRRPYDEMIYRARMRPPLGGLISIIPSHLKRRHASVSQRF